MANKAEGSRQHGFESLFAGVAVVMKRWYMAKRDFILGLAGVLVLFTLWQLAADLGLTHPVFTSSPKLVALAGWRLMLTTELWAATGMTVFEFLVGFVLSAIVGIIFGIMMGWYRTIYAIFNPFISALYALPRVALLPMFVLWFGIGMESRTVLTFSVAVLPIIVNTMVGMRILDPELLRVARSFGASDFQIFRTLALPASVPNILSGLRIGVGQGLIGVIVGELFIGNEGLGSLLSWYGASFLTSELMFVVLVTAVLGIGMVELLARIEKRFESWRPAIEGHK